MEELAETSKNFPQDSVQQSSADQTVEIPAVSLVEKIVEMPITQKTQQVVNTHVQHVVNTDEVERPKLVKETVQEKINQVTKHIKIPQVHFLNKVDDMLVDVQQQILPMAQTVQKTMEIPQLQCVDKVVDNPEAPQVQVSDKTVEISQLQAVGKIDEILEIRTDMDTQIFESLGTAPVCRSTQAEIVEAVEIEVPLPAESVSPMSVTEPVLEVPQIVGKIDEIPEIRTDVGGTALVKDTEASVLKTPDSIKAHDQASFKNDEKSEWRVVPRVCE